MKLINFYAEDLKSLLVEFHLKMLYSAHKNKKAPAYMLKSILISLDKIDFDRLKTEYRSKALEVLKLLKPNCYQIMIEIFSLKNEMQFFKELAEQKIKEEEAVRNLACIGDAMAFAADYKTAFNNKPILSNLEHYYQKW